MKTARELFLDEVRSLELHRKIAYNDAHRLAKALYPNLWHASQADIAGIHEAANERTMSEKQLTDHLMRKHRIDRPQAFTMAKKMGARQVAFANEMPAKTEMLDDAGQTLAPTTWPVSGEILRSMGLPTLATKELVEVMKLADAAVQTPGLAALAIKQLIHARQLVSGQKFDQALEDARADVPEFFDTLKEGGLSSIRNWPPAEEVLAEMGLPVDATREAFDIYAAGELVKISPPVAAYLFRELFTTETGGRIIFAGGTNGDAVFQYLQKHHPTVYTPIAKYHKS